MAEFKGCDRIPHRDFIAAPLVINNLPLSIHQDGKRNALAFEASVNSCDDCARAMESGRRSP
jgi:hypothetical protein